MSRLFRINKSDMSKYDKCGMTDCKEKVEYFRLWNSHHALFCNKHKSGFMKREKK